jgi:hypothetical protein
MPRGGQKRSRCLCQPHDWVPYAAGRGSQQGIRSLSAGTSDAKLNPEFHDVSCLSLRRRAQRWALPGRDPCIAGLRCHSLPGGASPEKIVQSFPTLKLSQVYGAIAYYLENENKINEYIAEGQRELERSVPPLSQTNPELFARLEAARRQIGSKRA